MNLIAVGAAVLAGILLLGLYGDRVLGAVIVGLIEIPVAGAKAIGRATRRKSRLSRPQGRAETRMTEGVARSAIERLG
jgi:hypothetical protein